MVSTSSMFAPLARRLEELATFVDGNVAISRVTDTDVVIEAIAGPLAATYPAGDAVPRGDREQYCEAVARTASDLFVRDALTEEGWQDNPDVDQGLVNYMGCPIHLGNGKVFGTVCYLDLVARDYSAGEKAQLEALTQEAETLVRSQEQTAMKD